MAITNPNSISGLKFWGKDAFFVSAATRPVSADNDLQAAMADASPNGISQNVKASLYDYAAFTIIAFCVAEAVLKGWAL